MPLSEFALIERYFRKAGAMRADVQLGVGDDAALLQSPPGAQLVAAIDTLVEGVHFPHGSPPASIGHRVLAVNLSDLAAMGARPAWGALGVDTTQDRRALAGGIYRRVYRAGPLSRCCTRGGGYNIRPLVGNHPDHGPRRQVDCNVAIGRTGGRSGVCIRYTGRRRRRARDRTIEIDGVE